MHTVSGLTSPNKDNKKRKRNFLMQGQTRLKYILNRQNHKSTKKTNQSNRTPNKCNNLNRNNHYNPSQNNKSTNIHCQS